MSVKELKDAVEEVIRLHVSAEDIGFTFSKVHENAKARENIRTQEILKAQENIKKEKK